ncbi:MAG: DNA polymerase III subunit delta [Gemmatimonadaceae bacterium]
MAPSTTFKALKAALESGRFDPVYLFHGADDYLKEEKVRALIARATEPTTRDFNLETLRGAEVDIATLGTALEALPMLAERRVVILRDAMAPKKAVRERLDHYLAAPAPELLLVLVVPAGAKPDAALLANANVSAVEFKPLVDGDLLKWIDHHARTACGATVLPEAAELLASYGGNDLALLAGELQKLAAYAGAAPIDKVAINAVTGVRPGHTLGDLLDLAAARDTAGAMALVEEVLSQPKQSAVTLVMALSAQMLAIGWGVAARARGLPAGRLEGEFFTLLKEGGSVYTGRPWGEAVKCWARAVPKWSAADIDRALPHLLAADAALKDTKVSSEAQIVTSLLLAITPAASRRRAA